MKLSGAVEYSDWRSKIPAIEIIGHRGASKDAPENTLSAFRLALEMGADGVEGDFRLTKDGQIVCMHDATTARTAGISLAVADTTLPALRQVDVGAWKGGKWSGERIPILQDIISLIPKEKKLLIELKSGPEIILPLKKILPESLENIAVLSFDAGLITLIRREIPAVKTLWLTDYRSVLITGEWLPSIGMILQTLQKTGATGLGSKAHHSIDAEFVQKLHDAGKEFHVWTVDSHRSAARFSALGADSIITNCPGKLKGMFSTGGGYEIHPRP